MPKKNSSWYVYILRCADRTFYSGITKDLNKRLAEHNSSVRGAKYTRGRRPVRLVYSCCCRSRAAAQKKEYTLRNLPRRDKQALIKK